MNSERTEVVIGATGRIARKYIDYLVNFKKVPAVLISRKGEGEFDGHPLVLGHVKQDLTSANYSALERVLDKDRLRIVYLAGMPKPNKTAPDYELINVEPVKRIIKEASGNVFTYASTYRVFGPREKGLGEDAKPFHQGNYYANSKRDGELATLDYAHGQVVRFATVLGMDGDFLQEMAKKISKGEEAAAWWDVFSRFAWINDVCFVLDRAGRYNGKQRVFHVASPDEIMSRYDLATWFLQTLQQRGSLPPESSALLLKTNFDFLDGRRPMIDIETKITERELSFSPTSLFGGLRESIALGYPYLNKN